MMRLSTIFTDYNDDFKYRFHLAKEADGAKPIDALAKSETEWLSWQVYRGNSKERFTTDYIVSFSQITGSKFLFGGVFQITDRTYTDYKVSYVEEFTDLIGRLILNYTGENNRGTVFKPSYIYENSVIAGIYESKFKGEPFISFDKVNHGFHHIENIIKNDLVDWKAALSSTCGIYLISDVSTGKHYVGSAYGQGGIWSRWVSYIECFHGDNIDLIRLYLVKGEDYFRSNLKFSILEIIAPNESVDKIIAKESLWKNKLLTKEHGHNKN